MQKRWLNAGDYCAISPFAPLEDSKATMLPEQLFPGLTF